MKISRFKGLMNFIGEAGLLKRVQRSGWWVIGIKHPESVADHSFRCAVIAYVIAKLESIHPYPAVIMALFGDIHEARINDSHKMAQRYTNAEASEDMAFAEQMKPLEPLLGDELSVLRRQYRAQKTKASRVARDADILECLIQAKEYYEYGFRQAAKFMQKAPRYLRTESARKLWKAARAMPLNDWWHDLSAFKR